MTNVIIVGEHKQHVVSSRHMMFCDNCHIIEKYSNVTFTES